MRYPGGHGAIPYSTPAKSPVPGRSPGRQAGRQAGRQRPCPGHTLTLSSEPPLGPALRLATGSGAALAGGVPWPGAAQPSKGLCRGELALGKGHSVSDTLTESEPGGLLTRLARSEQRSRH